ncbi:GntR family transcriptional regulator [cyanobacterium TDX16]|nr:GntR family transcriptional regulator [cyanobacterium TDX16]
MKIILNRHSPQPLYLQIRGYLSRLIQSGKLAPGEKLPSIRNLAASIGVNKLTIVEAYGELEADGLIQARPGAGYFISSAVSSPQRQSHFAPTQEVTISETGETFCEQIMAALQAQQQKEIINFSSGFPLTQELDNFQRIAKRAIANSNDTLFRYDLPQGQLVLRQQIAQMLLNQGLEVSPEEIIVTNGSEQGLSLAMRYYLQPGDWAIVETPTYHGALGILANLGVKVIGIPMTAEGMNLELLEQYLCSHRPKLIYTISTLHNPTGITTSQKHRQKLLALAQQYECPILEDNAYEALNFEFEPVAAPIKALDRSDIVTYISTFSKTLMPGLRVGYTVVTGKHYQPILEQKILQDLHSSTVSQAIVSEFLTGGHYRRYLNRLRTNHLHSRNAMLQALERYFPAQASWTIPQGGLFLWVHLPEGISVQAICREALSRKILVASGTAFFPNHQGYPALRLNFSNSLADIDRGVAVLGELVQKYLAAVVPQPSRAISDRPLEITSNVRVPNLGMLTKN